MKLRHLAPIVLLAACSSGGSERQAQLSPSGPLPRPVAAPAIFGLFGERQALGLTSEQVNRLEAIALELRQRNDSLETAIREEQQQRGRSRTVSARRRALRDALPTLGQIWSNNRRAMDQVHEVLTPAQRERACALEREQMDERGVEARRIPRRDNRPRSIRRLEPDSLAASGLRGWAWCAGNGALPQPASPSAAP